MRIREVHGVAGFRHQSHETSLTSIDEALADLIVAARFAGGEVVWSTLSIDFESRTIADHKLTEAHPRLREGRSTVRAKASVVLE